MVNQSVYQSETVSFVMVGHQVHVVSYLGQHAAMRQLFSNQSVDQPVISKSVRKLAIRQSHVSNHSFGQR